MGCLNSKKGLPGTEEEGSGGGIMDSIKSQVFSMVLQTSSGGEGDSKFAFAKNLIGKFFPQANITRQANDEAPDGTFNALIDGKQVFSEKKDGDVRDNPDGFIAKIKAFLMSKIGMG